MADSFSSVRQYQTSSNPPQPAGKEASSGQPTQRSSALVPAAAIAAVIGGIALYNYRQTGNPDGIAKAMVCDAYCMFGWRKVSPF
jgi:hypothetical protein